MVSLSLPSVSPVFPGGPGRRSTRKPTACNIRRMTPLAQYVVNIPLYSYKRKESEIIARSTFLVAFQGRKHRSKRDQDLVITTYH